MTLPAGYRPRKGDVVIVHATVKFDADSDLEGIHVKVDYHSMRLDRNLIQGIAAYHFDPGDTVQFKDDPDHLKIVAVHGFYAWGEEIESGTMFTHPLRELKLIAPKQEKTDDNE